MADSLSALLLDQHSSTCLSYFPTLGAPLAQLVQLSSPCRANPVLAAQQPTSPPAHQPTSTPAHYLELSCPLQLDIDVQALWRWRHCSVQKERPLCAIMDPHAQLLSYHPNKGILNAQNILIGVASYATMRYKKGNATFPIERNVKIMILNFWKKKKIFVVYSYVSVTCKQALRNLQQIIQ